MNNDSSESLSDRGTRASAALVDAVMKGRVARVVEDLDDETLKAIANSAVPDEYAALDEIIKDCPGRKKLWCPPFPTAT